VISLNRLSAGCLAGTLARLSLFITSSVMLA
jgi:hypothetical protein